MPESDETTTTTTTQGSAGSPRRSTDAVSFSAAAEPSADELDQRQARMAETRRSGPPLPAVPESPGVSFGLSSESKPTEVEEKEK